MRRCLKFFSLIICPVFLCSQLLATSPTFKIHTCEFNPLRTDIDRNFGKMLKNQNGTFAKVTVKKFVEKGYLNDYTVMEKSDSKIVKDIVKILTEDCGWQIATDSDLAAIEESTNNGDTDFGFQQCLRTEKIIEDSLTIGVQVVLPDHAGNNTVSLEQKNCNIVEIKKLLNKINDLNSTVTAIGFGSMAAATAIFVAVVAIVVLSVVCLYKISDKPTV